MEGRIEICIKGQWGTITDDAWGTSDAKTACRQLGFAAYGQSPHALRLNVDVTAQPMSLVSFNFIIIYSMHHL